MIWVLQEVGSSSLSPICSYTRSTSFRLKLSVETDSYHGPCKFCDLNSRELAIPNCQPAEWSKSKNTRIKFRTRNRYGAHLKMTSKNFDHKKIVTPFVTSFGTQWNHLSIGHWWAVTQAINGPSSREETVKPMASLSKPLWSPLQSGLQWASN